MVVPALIGEATKSCWWWLHDNVNLYIGICVCGGWGDKGTRSIGAGTTDRCELSERVGTRSQADPLEDQQALNL